MIIRIPYELLPINNAKDARAASAKGNPRARKASITRKAVPTETVSSNNVSEPVLEVPADLPSFVDELIESAVVPAISPLDAPQAAQSAREIEQQQEDQADEALTLMSLFAEAQNNSAAESETKPATLASQPAAQKDAADLVGAWEALLAVTLDAEEAEKKIPVRAQKPAASEPLPQSTEGSEAASTAPIPQVARFLRHDVAVPTAALARKAAASEQPAPAPADVDDVDALTSQQAHAFLKALIEIAELEAPANEEADPTTEAVSQKEDSKVEPPAATFAGVLAGNAARLSEAAPQMPAVTAPGTASILVPPPAGKTMPRPPALLRAWWWLKKNQRFTAAKQLRVVETVSLGEKRFAAIIQADGKRLLVGGAPSGVSVLAELDATSDARLTAGTPGSAAE